MSRPPGRQARREIGERRHGVAEEHHAEAGDHRVERLRGVRVGAGIGHHPVDPVLADSPPGCFDHGAGDVDPGHLAPGWTASRAWPVVAAASAADIEHAVAGSQRGPLEQCVGDRQHLRLQGLDAVEPAPSLAGHPRPVPLTSHRHRCAGPGWRAGRCGRETKVKSSLFLLGAAEVAVKVALKHRAHRSGQPARGTARPGRTASAGSDRPARPSAGRPPTGPAVGLGPGDLHSPQD